MRRLSITELNARNLAKRSRGEIAPAIAAHQYLSVDIFDTLLFRLCRSPVDVFLFMEQRPEVAEVTRHFAEYRVAAEHQAREDAKKLDIEDVSHEKIYTCFREYSNCSAEHADVIRRIELETEMALLQPTNFGKLFLEHVRETGKRFVLTSDMYLPRQFLENVLTAKGIHGWEHVFVSNEHGRTKHSGTLFRDVIGHFEVEPEEILHIGDNKHADGKMARGAGLKSHLVMASKDLAERSRIARKHSQMFSGRRPLSQLFIAHYLEKHHFETDVLDFRQLSDDAYFEAVGAVLVAPIMLSMMLWLKTGMDKNGLKRVAFLARDGMFPKALFDMLWPEGYQTEYVAASRRLLTLPFTKLDESSIHRNFRSTLDGCSTLLEFFNKIAAGKQVINLFEGIETCARTPLTRKSRKLVLQKLKDNPVALYRSFDGERDTIKKYFRSVFPPASRTAVFDVGWRGSLQRSICQIVDKSVQVHGYYFGTSRPAATILSRNGLSFESFTVHNGLPKSKEAWVMDFRDLVEFLFSANHGSVLKLSEDGQGGFTWHTADVPDIERANMIVAGKIQKAALEAIAEVKSALPVSFLEKHTTDHDEDDLFNFFSKPHRQDALRFSTIRIFNGIGDTTGESLTRIGEKGSHYRNVKISRWRAAYGVYMSALSRAWVNLRLRKRKHKKFRV